MHLRKQEISPMRSFVKPHNLANLTILFILVVVGLPEYMLTHFLSLGYVLAENQLLDTAIPERIVFNAHIIIDLVIIVLLLVFWFMGNSRNIRIVGLAYATWVTLLLLINFVGLNYTLFLPNRQGETLLLDAGLVWVSITLLFTLWYWLLDGVGTNTGGECVPRRRDFAFPQQDKLYAGWDDWQPRFMDYLFLAFITSASFTPTDITILSRRCKVLMMLQVSLSVLVIAVLLSRALGLLSQG